MIRRMCENDIPQIAELERKYFSVPWLAKSLKQSLKRPEYLFLVVEKEGEAVGYGGFFRVLEEGNITNIVIDERYRGKGLGKALVRALLEEGRHLGILAFTLEVRAGNEAAVCVYKQLGFVQEGIRKRFYEKPVEDALIMWKRFSAV